MLGLGQMAEMLSSGALLGWLLTAMLLGHYYLNWPGMKLEPLQRLLIGLLWAVAARAMVSAIGLAFHQQLLADINAVVGGLLGLRWLAGIIGPAVTGRMAQLTLRIPNTQSATGILYAGTIMALLGELVAELLAPPGKIPL
ncbi:MAG: hypothetical protein KatS3mg110_0063 [Pirellulaceae bacterium]|nr:MAG: hypothetical protein KatS3mg110_0063 [Pirellulaceae bacterium]